jgi:beta-galactosidase
MREILNAGSSVNQYMFHGGTSFGWMAGSNWLSKKQRATSDTTSYDYDAPLSESGDITEKWNITREIINEYFPNCWVLSELSVSL